MRDIRPAYRRCRYGMWNVAFIGVRAGNSFNQIQTDITYTIRIIDIIRE